MLSRGSWVAQRHVRSLSVCRGEDTEFGERLSIRMLSMSIKQ